MKCHKCEAEVQPEWKACPECAEKLPTRTQCKGCGGELKPHWKACPECGVPVAGSAAVLVGGLSNDSGVMKAEGDIVGGHKQVGDFRRAGGANVGGNIIFQVPGLAVPSSSPLVVCPACGMRREIKDTFRCRVCGLDHLCREHFDPDFKSCEACAVKDRDRATARMIARLLPETAAKKEAPRGPKPHEGLQEIRAELCGLQDEQKRSGDELGMAVAVRDKFGQEFVLVPPGEFIYGGEYGHAQETRSLEEAFYIGKHPVTRGQWERFVREDGYDWAMDVSKHSPKANSPITGVNWDDGVAYCRWMSREMGLEYRLPTEEEWEKAARGIDGRKYPWGNAEPTSRYAHFNQDASKGATLPVGSMPGGRSPYGCHDMAGNVWEWCEEWYNDDQDARVLRGGSWNGNFAGGLLSSCRYDGAPGGRDDGVGFRVVLVGLCST